jgi:glycosyltransferase 2 family protein
LKLSFKKIFTTFFPILLGLAIIYYQYTTLTVEELNNIKEYFQKADYFWIFVSLFVALFGFWSRAYRWQYTLGHLGYQSKMSSNFTTVCISYFMNLTIPRSGEVTRAVLIKKYEDIPFDKAFGTIVAERIIDFALFLLIVLVAFIVQFHVLIDFVKDKFSFSKIIIFGVILIISSIASILIWYYAEWKIIKKIKKKLAGLIEGLTSVLYMKNKWKFLFHSVFIWFTYLLMFYVTIFALPETSTISLPIVLMGFIFGSLAVGFTSGGLGAYPLAVALILSLYGVSNDVGTAFGWLIWTSQTILIIILGLLSYLYLALSKRH